MFLNLEVFYFQIFPIFVFGSFEGTQETLNVVAGKRTMMTGYHWSIDLKTRHRLLFLEVSTNSHKQRVTEEKEKVASGYLGFLNR